MFQFEVPGDSPAYLQAHGRPAKPEDLLDHYCLCLPSTPTGLWTFPGVNQGKPLAVQGRFRSNDVDSLLEAAVAGLGVAHLASWLIYKKVATGELINLFPDSVAAAAAEGSLNHAPAIHAVRLKGRSHPAKAKLFINHLKQSFGSSPYWQLAVEPTHGETMNTGANPEFISPHSNRPKKI